MIIVDDTAVTVVNECQIEPTYDEEIDGSYNVKILVRHYDSYKQILDYEFNVLNEPDGKVLTDNIVVEVQRGIFDVFRYICNIQRIYGAPDVDIPF